MINSFLKININHQIDNKISRKMFITKLKKKQMKKFWGL